MEKFLKNQQIPLTQVVDPNTGQAYYAPQNVVYQDKIDKGATYLKDVIVDQAITASYFSGSITNAISASYALTASYFSGSIANAVSASYALTASYALNAGPTINTGSFLTTASFNAYTGSNTSQFAGTASFALTASYVSGSVAAPGATTQVVFNNGGVLGANSGFVYSGSNVGIGTTTPSASLHISGSSGSALLEIDSPAVNNILFVSGSGRIGVGTNTPTHRLTVQGTTLIDSSVSAQGSFNLNPVTAPGAIGGFTLATGSSLGVGTYYYFAAYVTALGETNAGSVLLVTTTTGTTTVNLTGIPTSIDPRVTARKLYRTKLGGTSDNEWFLATISNNTTTTYTDTIADASLTGVGLQGYKINTTSRYITTNGTQGMILDGNLTTLGLNAGAGIISTNAASVRSVFIGNGAGQNVTTGAGNTLVGGLAGGNLTTGASNTLIGDLAGYVISNASNNVVVGTQTARYLTTGGSNIIIGSSAASVLTDGTTQFTQGTNNTVVGPSIRMSTITDTNSIVIGSTAWGLGSNTAVLGNDSITRTALKGNVSIGTTGSISSTLHVKGSGATSATTALRVENTNASASFIVRDDLRVGIGTATPTQALDVVGSIYLTGNITAINSISAFKYGAGNAGTGGGLEAYFNVRDINTALTSSVYYDFGSARNVNPTSGTFIYNAFTFGGTINQTGGANGITRGFYANPTLTSASNWRSFEFTNNTNWGIYGSGSANNALRGNLVIGSLSIPTTTLDVSGSGRFTNGLTVTGSLTSPSITGSLLGTASYATQALSASWAPGGGASFPYTGSAEITGSLNITGSLTVNNGTSTVLDTSINRLYDNSEIPSLDWNNRILYEPNGNTALLYDAPNSGYSLLSAYYYLSLKRASIQDRFSSYPQNVSGQVNYDGDVIGGDLHGSVALHDLIYLDTSGAWYPISQSLDSCTRLIGICVDVDNSYILLEGSLTISSNIATSDSPYVQSLAHGRPIYIKNDTGSMMSTVIPSTPGNYVRVLGHAYYQNPSSTDYWIMKFRPSNDWIQI
jgi:hypothetical protein